MMNQILIDDKKLIEIIDRTKIEEEQKLKNYNRILGFNPGTEAE